ncbi:MAG: tetratricopeptide repeat protein, partial [Treponema sp.]|nr:tetratricopeptide repeat protein [Treponema sp.]
ACVYTDPDKAIAEINEAIQINSESAEAYYYRGLAYYLKEKPELNAALKDLEHALELKPNSNLINILIEAVLKDIKK